MSARLLLLLISTTAALTSCFNCGASNRGGMGGGRGGSSSSTSMKFDLIEATGEWNLATTSSSGACTHTTTSSRKQLSLAAPQKAAATFISKLLIGLMPVTITTFDREATTKCAGAPQPCPSPGSTSRTVMSLKADPLSPAEAGTG